MQDARIGTDFAITNSGGLRADLTCPTRGPSRATSARRVPAARRTRSRAARCSAVLPFGNIVVTVTINGAELKDYPRERRLADAVGEGRFPQVSGLCFTYDIAAAAGSRVTGVVRADAAGNCTATPVDLTAGVVVHDRPERLHGERRRRVPERFARPPDDAGHMEQVMADYITAHSPLTPFVKAAPNGRVNCTDSDGPAGRRAATARRWFRLRRERGARRPAAHGGGSPAAPAGQARSRRPRRQAAPSRGRRERAGVGGSRGCL